MSEFDDILRAFRDTSPEAVERRRQQYYGRVGQLQTAPLAQLETDPYRLSTSTGADALKDPKFLAELKDYFRIARGRSYDSDDKLIEEFYREMTRANFNSLGIAESYKKISGADQRVRDLFNRMREVYDTVPAFYEEGGRGLAGFTQVAVNTVVDPINLIGFGVGGAAAKGAIAAGKPAIQAAARSGATSQALGGAAVAGGFDAATQARDIESGYQDQFNFGRFGRATGLGAGLGAALGYAGGRAAGRSAQGQAGEIQKQRLLELNYSEEQANQLLAAASEDQINNILANNLTPEALEKQQLETFKRRLIEAGKTDQEADDIIANAQSPDEIERAISGGPEAAESAPNTPRVATEEEFNARVDQEKQNNPDLTEETAREAARRGLAGEGYSRAVIDGQEEFIGSTRTTNTRKLQMLQDEVDSIVTQLDEDILVRRRAGEPVEDLIDLRTEVEKLRGLPARLDQYDVEIRKNLESSDPTVAAKGARQIAEVNELRDLLSLIREVGVRDASEILRRERQLAQQLELEASAQKKVARAQADKQAREAAAAEAAPAAPEGEAAAATPEAAAPEAAAAPEPEAAPAPEPEPDLTSIRFTQKNVFNYAESNGLVPADFEGVTQSGVRGYSKADVDGIIAAKRGAAEEAAPAVEDVAPAAVAEGEVPPASMPRIEWSYRSDAQRDSIQKILAKEGLDEADLDDLIQAGDVEVSPNGKLTKEGNKSLRRKLEERGVEKAPETGFDKQLEGISVKALRRLAERGLPQDHLEYLIESDPEKLRAIMRLVDPKNGDAITDYILGQSGSGANITARMASDASGIPGLKLTKTERKLVVDRRKAYVASGMDEADAALKANRDVIAMRADKAAGKLVQQSDVSGTLSRPPIDVTAGRNKSGGIQRLLKYAYGGMLNPVGRIDNALGDELLQTAEAMRSYGNRLIEDQYDLSADEIKKVNAAAEGYIADGATPERARTLAEGEVRRARPRQQVRNTAPVRGYATDAPLADGSPRVKYDEDGNPVLTKDGRKVMIREKAKAGEPIFYDPITNAFYRNERAMRKARNETDTLRPEPFAPDQYDELFQNLGDDAEAALDALIGSLKQNSPPSRPAAAPDTRIDLPPVRRTADGGEEILAVRMGDGIIRVLSEAQISSNKGVRALIGDNTSLSEIEVGYVRAPATSGSYLANKTFTKVDPDSPDPSQFKPVITSTSAKGSIINPVAEDFERLIPEAERMPGKSPTDKVGEPAKILQRLVNKINSDADVTKFDIDATIQSIEFNIGWPRGETATASVADFMIELLELRRKYVPEEIRAPSAKVSENIKALRSKSLNYTGREKAQIKRILNSIALATGRRPNIVPTDSAREFVRGVDPLTGRDINEIRLPNYFRGFGTAMDQPKMAQFLHELGHWLYANALSVDDRIAFWAATKKYLGDAEQNLPAFFGVNEQKLRERLPIPEDEVRLSFDDVNLNQADNPQEFFANQFAIFGMRERVDSIFRTEKMFDERMRAARMGPDHEAYRPIMGRLFRLAKSIYNRFFGQEAIEIDEDLLPIFERILPDTEEATRAMNLKNAQTATGARLLERGYSLREHSNNLHDAIANDDSYAIVDAADNLARELFGIAGRASNSNNPSPPHDPFRVLREVHGKARDLSRKLHEAIGIKDELEGGYYDEDGLYVSNIDPDVVADNIVKAISGADGSLDSARVVGEVIDEIRKKFNQLDDESVKLTKSFELDFKRPRTTTSKRYAKASLAKKQKKKAEKRKVKAAAARAAREGQPEPSMNPAEAMLPVRSMTDDQLAQELAQEGGTDRGRIIANEIERRERAGPASVGIGSKSERVSQALENEAAHSAGNGDTAIPAAPEPIRQALELISARDPDRRNTAQTLFYRIMNLLNPESALDGSPFPTGRTLRLIADADPSPDFSDGVRILDFKNSKEFNAARLGVRRMATNLSKTKTGKQKAAEAVLQDLADLVYRLGLYDTSSQFTRESFTKALVSHLRASDRSVLEGLSDPNFVDAIITGADSIAYLTNGLIARSDIAQSAPNLGRYGDMFGGTSSPVSHVTKTTKEATTAPGVYSDHLAAELAEQTLLGLPVPLRRAVAKFTGASSPKIYFVPWRGGNPKTPSSEKTPVGSGFRISRNISDIAEINDPDVFASAARELGKTDNEIEEILEVVQQRQSLVEKAEKRRMDAQTATPKRAKGLLKSAEDIDMQIQELDADYLSELFEEAYGHKMGVVPFVLSDSARKNSISFESATKIDVNELMPIISRMIGKFGVSRELVYDVMQGRASPGSDITGDEALQILVDLISGGFDNNGFRKLNSTDRYQELQRVLKDMGYESVRFENFDIVFDAKNIKHLEDFAPDIEPDITAKMTVGARAVNRELVSSALEGHRINGDTESYLRFLLAADGTPQDVVSAMNKAMNGKVPNAREVGSFRRFFQSFLAQNTTNTRRAGMHWIADWVAPSREAGTGHFERIAGQTGQVLQPVLRSLRKLPEAGGIAAWRRRALDYGFVPEGVKETTPGLRQPKAYKKIVRALRRDPGSKQEQALTPDELGVYKSIRAMFGDMHRRLVEAGVMIGNVTPYFPQVWSVEKIKANQDQFLDALSRYLLDEAASSPRSSPMSKDDSMVIARRIMGNLIDDDGVYTPPPVSSRSPVGDHVDYQRLIRLDKFQNHLDDVGRFLEDDLEAIIAKYVDNGMRRIDFAAKFGEGNHGFHDYISVMEDSATGLQAVARLLSSNKIEKRNFTARSTTPGGETDEVVLERLTSMPFKSLEGALPAAKKALEMAEKGDAASLRNFLLALDTNTADYAQRTYAKRVDAIVGGLMDRQRIGNKRPAAQDIKEATALMRTTMRKPVDAGGTFFEMSHGVSKWSRNIMSLTLLGFTTLTSLGDPALVAIRSGNLKAFSEGIGKWITDPEYREMIRGSGVAIEQLVHERMTGLYGTDASRTTTAFFNATLLSPWTSMQRQWAGAVALQWFHAEMKKAAKAYDPSKPLQQQSGQYKKSYRILRRYGVEGLLDSRETTGFDPMLPDFEKMPQLRDGMIKFANETIFTPNPNDIPLWAQTPIGAMVFQLKSFPLMMQRLAADTLVNNLRVDPVTQGGRRFSPLLMMATLGPLGGATALGAKDFVQQRGEDDNTFRRRSLSKILGHDENIHGPLDEFIGWYAEGFAMMGGLGLVAELMHDSVEQLDQGGAYGSMRFMSNLAGPSFGAVYDVTQVGQGLVDAATEGRENGTGVERAGARAVVRRVPVLGGVRSLRESAVDVIAGESTRGKANNSSWDSQWGGWETNEWDSKWGD